MPKFLSNILPYRWQPELRDPHTLTSADIKKIKRLSDQAGDRWSETFATISKWVFATLITLSTGGIYLSLTLGIHPDASTSALKQFFVAIILTLLSAAALIAPLVSKLAFADEVLSLPDPKGFAVERAKYSSLFKRGSGPIVSIFLMAASLVVIMFAGIRLSEGVSRCTVSELETGIAIGQAIVPGPKGATKRCYFYEIEGLSNDPLERALQERKLIQQAGSLKSSR